jgi:carbonic anhydrase
MKPEEALAKLRSGNERFSNGRSQLGSGIGQTRLQELTGGQAPYATVLTCSDSRVAPEYIFDAGLGDIFICRNAGNVLDEVTLGSIEYAAAHTGCPLLVVLGHQSCGACTATVAHVKNPDMHETDNVDDIVRRIMPAVIATPSMDDQKAYVDQVAKTNVAKVCRQVTQRSPLLGSFIQKGEYQVVGAFYNLASGKVDFFD